MEYISEVTRVYTKSPKKGCAECLSLIAEGRVRCDTGLAQGIPALATGFICGSVSLGGVGWGGSNKAEMKAEKSSAVPEILYLQVETHS